MNNTDGTDSILNVKVILPPERWISGRKPKAATAENYPYIKFKVSEKDDKKYCMMLFKLHLLTKLSS